MEIEEQSKFDEYFLQAFQKLLFRLLSNSVNIKIQPTIINHVVLYRCGNIFHVKRMQIEDKDGLSSGL